MEQFPLYPFLNEKMQEDAGVKAEQYRFSYSLNDNKYELKQKGTSTIKIDDDFWKVDQFGINIEKEVTIAYPDLLKGRDGIACEGATIGIYIIWRCKSVTRTGCIMPHYDEETPSGRICKFSYTFEPNTIINDLELDLVMYIKQKAENVGQDELFLINENGARVGEIENVDIVFEDLYLDFPIEEYNSKDEPLWWVELSDWRENSPGTETFTKDNVCLYLNTYYDCCPRPNLKTGKIENEDILIDILAQTYFLIFKQLEDCGWLEKVKYDDAELMDGSIGKVIFGFISNCEGLEWDLSWKTLKSLQNNVRKMMAIGD